MRALDICGKSLRVDGRLIRTARLAAEGFEFLTDPDSALGALRQTGFPIDLFTFTQTLTNTSPRYSYPMEWDNVAALPVSSYDQWWTRQLNDKTRNMVRRAEKKGVVVREVPFDDALLRGIHAIYNESPIRQGKQFPHYGKDIETVRTEKATFPDRSLFIGAFLGETLVGFAKLVSDDDHTQVALMQIVSMIQHRDKAPTNALIAHAVRSCADRHIPYLVYEKFHHDERQTDTLADFKRYNGFRRIDVPRYYIPLTMRGRVGFRLGLHHPVGDYVPDPVLGALRRLRSSWYEQKLQASRQPS